MRTAKTMQRLVLAATLAVAITVLPGWRGSERAESAQAASSTIFGVVLVKGGGAVKVSISLFSADWTYLRAVNSTSGGVFRFSGVAPGTYHLQASDRAKPWDINRRARTDATVTVGAGQSAEADLVMGRGAFVTGTVSVGKKSATVGRRATVRVVSQYGGTYETTADSRGRFAVGGLPGGQTYSVFTWDKKKKWTGRSIFVGKLKAGRGENIRVRLRTRAGAYVGILRVNGVPATGTIWATMVNNKTGQWWTAPIVNGDLSRFKGLYPGTYRLQLPLTSVVLAQTLTVPAIRAGGYSLVRLDAKAAPVVVKPTSNASKSASPSASASGSASDTASGSSTNTTSSAPVSTSTTSSAPVSSSTTSSAPVSSATSASSVR